jgi:hypothetical protein
VRYYTCVKLCHSCKKDPSIGRTVGRRDACPVCGADLHCCLNCRFYKPSVSKQCGEPAAALQKEKTKANFCDYFVFTDLPDTDTSNRETEQARKAIDALFKK